MTLKPDCNCSKCRSCTFLPDFVWVKLLYDGDEKKLPKYVKKLVPKRMKPMKWLAMFFSYVADPKMSTQDAAIAWIQHCMPETITILSPDAYDCFVMDVIHLLAECDEIAGRIRPEKLATFDEPSMN